MIFEGTTMVVFTHTYGEEESGLSGGRGGISVKKQPKPNGINGTHPSNSDWYGLHLR